MNMKSVHILLVEDNEGDILLIEEALEEGKVINTISKVRDGEKAIRFLQHEGEYAGAELPDLIILDINLPRKNGHEVLQFIKQSKTLKHIPVIMLTTSSSERDILKSYQHHANCYITKPVGAEDFINAVTGIENFWIKLVKLPPDE
jgi:CheY-like chemotaxis protein